MTTRYENRQTVGKRLDLTQLAYQQMPLVRPEGYAWRGVPSQGLKHHPKTDVIALKAQKKADRERAKAERQAKKAITHKPRMNAQDRIKIVVSVGKTFHKASIADALGVSEAMAKIHIKKWREAGLIVDTGYATDTGAMIYAQTGYVPSETDKKAGMLPSKDVLKKAIAERNARTGERHNAAKIAACFGEDRQLSTAQIIERLGVLRPAGLSTINIWRKRGLVEHVGYDSKTKVWELRFNAKGQRGAACGASAAPTGCASNTGSES